MVVVVVVPLVVVAAPAPVPAGPKEYAFCEGIEPAAPAKKPFRSVISLDRCPDVKGATPPQKWNPSKACCRHRQLGDKGCQWTLRRFQPRIVFTRDGPTTMQVLHYQCSTHAPPSTPTPLQASGTRLSSARYLQPGTWPEGRYHLNRNYNNENRSNTKKKVVPLPLLGYVSLSLIRRLIVIIIIINGNGKRDRLASLFSHDIYEELTQAVVKDG